MRGSRHPFRLRGGAHFADVDMGGGRDVISSMKFTSGDRILLSEGQVRSQTTITRSSSTGLRPAICLLVLGTCAALFVPIFHVSVSVKAQEKAPLKLITTTPLPGFSGDFDHFAVDLKGNRLFLAAEDHKTVEVFELRSGKPLHSITGFGQPHAILFLPDTNKLIVTDGDDFGRVSLVNGKSYEIIDNIKLPPGVDG